MVEELSVIAAAERGAGAMQKKSRHKRLYPEQQSVSRSNSVFPGNFMLTGQCCPHLFGFPITPARRIPL